MLIVLKREYVILYISQNFFCILYIFFKLFIKLCILYTEFCLKYKIRTDKKIHIKLILQKTENSSSTFFGHDHYSFIRAAL